MTATDAEATAAARARVAALLERIARVELSVIVVARPDQLRLAARDRATAAAIEAGRGSLLEDAVGAARDVTLHGFATAAFSGTWVVTEMAASVATANDRVAAATAFEEAATAAVVEDLVDDDTLEVLRATSEQLVRSAGLPSPGSLTTFASPAATAVRGPLQAAIVAGFVLLCAAIGFAVGLAFGLLVLAIGVAIIAGLTRSGPRLDP